MVNEIVLAVAKAVKTAFPAVPVYTEKVEQGIEEPSFVVRCFRDRHDRFRGDRYLKTHSIEVQYFPPADSRRENANAVGESLFWVLECLTGVGSNNDTVRGRNLEAHMDESYTVIFTALYDYFVLVSDDDLETMNSLTEEVTADEEED